jgi:hypothetical protein
MDGYPLAIEHQYVAETLANDLPVYDAILDSCIILKMVVGTPRLSLFDLQDPCFTS